MSIKFYVIRNQSGVVCFRFILESERDVYFDRYIDESSRMFKGEELIKVMDYAFMEIIETVFHD